MNCRRARELFDELLNGTLTDRAPLDRHVDECEACRAELRRLQQVHEAVARTVRRDVDEARLERATEAILAGITASPPVAAVAAVRLRWASVALAAALAAFVLGTQLGRTLWPEQVVVTKLVPRTEVVERIVEVKVPVVQERVVVKQVPVVRTRVVYRDRPVPQQPALQTGAPPEPVKADELVVSLNASLVTVHPVVSREVHPVTVVVEPDTDPGQEEPDRGARGDVREEGTQPALVLAQNTPSRLRAD